MSYPVPKNEKERVAALRRYQLLDTAPERFFDDIALIASQICGTPIALVTLVDDKRQWFKAKIGLEGTETPREHSFCTHAILQNEVMVVEDAATDERFAHNPYVTAEPGVRFYAGAPLIDCQGYGLGALCAVDRKPRKLSEDQKKTLEALARQVVAMCEYRRISGELAKVLSEVKILRGLLPICSYCKCVRNEEGYWRSIESYIAAHSEADFTHGICTTCLKEHFPTVHKRLEAEGKLDVPGVVGR